MRKKILIRLSFLTAILTILWSCRSEDFIQSEKNPQRSNKDFFKHSENGGSTSRTGVDYIDLLEAYNREKDFTSHIPDQDGMPIWEKMKIVHGENVTSLMIPLSTDAETMSSIVFALIDNDGNRVKDVNNITNDELKRVVYSKSYSTEERESLFNTFMVMDNYAFGTEAFTNIPPDLYIGYKMGPMNNQLNFHAPRVKETDVKEQIDTSGKVIIVQDYVCAIIRHCTHHGPGPCDGCGACKTESCSHSTIFVYTYPDPETGVVIYGNGEGGGGGGTPATIPDPDPCGLSKAFYRLAPNCNGNPEPPEPIENPCEKIKAKFIQQKYKSKKDSIDKSSFYNKKHETGFREQKNGDLEDLPQSSSNSLSLTFNSNTLGYTHVHLNDSPTGNQNDQGEDEIEIKIRIHSPADVNTLMEMAEMNLGTGNLEDVYGTMLSSDGTYVIKFTGLDTDIKTGFDTKPWRDKFRDYFKENKDRTNETNFLLFLKNEMHINGISLFKIKSNDVVYEIKLNSAGTKAISEKCSG